MVFLWFSYGFPMVFTSYVSHYQMVPGWGHSLGFPDQLGGGEAALGAGIHRATPRERMDMENTKAK